MTPWVTGVQRGCGGKEAIALYYRNPEQKNKGDYQAMPDQPHLEEQAVSQVAKTQLSKQVDAAEEIDVDIHTDLLKMAQGHADSISVEGKGLVTKQDLHMQEVELHTSPLDINPLSVLLGKIELTHPVDSTGRIVFTEADINQNINSDYVLSQLKPLQLDVDGQIVPIRFQRPMELKLPGDNKIIFSSNIEIPDRGKIQRVRSTSVIYPRTDEHGVLIEKFHFEEGQAITLEIMVALVEKIKELSNLRYLEFEGTAFHIRKMEVQKGSITVQIETHTEQIPFM